MTATGFGTGLEVEWQFCPNPQLLSSWLTADTDMDSCMMMLSVSGVPCEMAMGGGVEGWCGSAYGAVKVCHRYTEDRVFLHLGCSTGHTIPVTCDTAPATGTGYAGTGKTHGFQPDTTVYQYHGCTHNYIYILFTKNIHYSQKIHENALWGLGFG